MHRIVILWLLEFAAFLMAFWQWHLHMSQVALHAVVIGLISGSVLSACRVARVAFGRKTSLFRVVAGVLLATYFLAVCVMHLAVLAALSAWGQLPTIDMVGAYVRELQFLESSIGVSASEGFGLVLLAWLVCVVVHVILIRPRLPDGGGLRAGGIQPRIPPRTAVLALALLVVAVPTAAALYFENPIFAAASEPLYVAVNGDVWKEAQTNPITDLRVQQLQKRDDEARAAYRASAAPHRKTVVVITVDALRSDHMSLYGYARKTTPVLDALAELGKINKSTQARSPCAESFCGLLSLLTGKHAHKLASRDFGLVEVLGLHGYRRHAILAGDHARFYGLRERYGPFDTYADGGTMSAAGGINDDAAVLARLATLPANPSDPTLLFIHLMSVHGLGRKHPEYQRWLPTKSVYNLRVKKPDAALLAEVSNGYDNGVLQADAMIGKILGTLAAKGYMERAIVFVTGDHGDLLGEHGEFSHSRTLFDPVLRVPWVWIGDDARQLPLNQPVVHSDFAPSLLRMLNMPLPQHWDGRVLQEGVGLLQSFHQQSEFAGLIDYTGNTHYKYLFDRKRLKSYVYDLTADPAESVNIVNQTDAERQRQWKRLLDREQLTAPYACGQDLGC